LQGAAVANLLFPSERHLVAVDPARQRDGAVTVETFAFEPDRSSMISEADF
jgi:hypothetical protein